MTSSYKGVCGIAIFNIKSITYAFINLFRINIYFCYLNNNTVIFPFYLCIFALYFSAYFLTSSSKFT